MNILTPMNNVVVTEKSFEQMVEIIKSSWICSRGWYVAVRRDAQQGDLWMRTRSAETAARMTCFGFLGTCPTEARWSKLRLKDLPVYL
jgi:hypothetical protein